MASQNLDRCCSDAGVATAAGCTIVDRSSSVGEGRTTETRPSGAALIELRWCAGSSYVVTMGAGLSECLFLFMDIN